MTSWHFNLTSVQSDAIDAMVTVKAFTRHVPSPNIGLVVVFVVFLILCILSVFKQVITSSLHTLTDSPFTVIFPFYWCCITCVAETVMFPSSSPSVWPTRSFIVCTVVLWLVTPHTIFWPSWPLPVCLGCR